MGDLTGFYGKLPTHGDFISRNLPRTFIDPWDNWLQSSIAASREQLGEQWLEYFLVTPAWRFILSDGNCGEHAWIGVMIPSVDRVGRYFPLTIASHITEPVKPVALIDECYHWFEQAEEQALKVLDEDFDLDELEASLKKMGEPVVSRISENEPLDEIHKEERFQGHFSMDTVNANPLSAFPAVSHFFIEQTFSSYSFWWTAGSEDIKPSFLLCEGMPKNDGFAAFMDGGWNRECWHDIKSLFSVGDTPAIMGV